MASMKVSRSFMQHALAVSHRRGTAVFGLGRVQPFSSTVTRKETNIKVTDYHHGEAIKDTFDSSKYPAAQVATGEKALDEAHVAKPLPLAVREQLNATMKAFTLTGKTAIVTGGARGLGNNMAQALAEAGVENLALFDINKELGDRVAKELHEQTGAHVTFYEVDIRTDGAMSSAVQDVVERYGDLHILINSAGIAESNIKAEEYCPKQWRKTMDVNLIGAFVVNQAFGQQLIKLGHGGSIINVASMSGGVVNYPQGQNAYNASKAGVIMMSKSLAAEWARYGIRVNCISPGYMDTALNRVPALDAQKVIWIDNTPQKRLGNVNDLNGLAVYLASDASSYMTGANNIIDGGYTLW